MFFIDATIIRTRRDIQCLPYAGFLLRCPDSSREVWRNQDESGGIKEHESQEALFGVRRTQDASE